MTDYNRQIVEEFRAGGGQVASVPFPVLLLHHVGARSGTSMVSPLAYLQDGGRYVVFASKAGAPTNPAWYHNLIAHPEVTIEVGGQVLEVRAEVLGGEERDRLFAAQATAVPQFADYARKTSRRIPVLALMPRD